MEALTRSLDREGYRTVSDMCPPTLLMEGRLICLIAMAIKAGMVSSGGMGYEN